jgi:hypothetical protein
VTNDEFRRMMLGELPKTIPSWNEIKRQIDARYDWRRWDLSDTWDRDRAIEGQYVEVIPEERRLAR